ncbi:MAG TPA: AmmeMemoRadiSam system protein B [candidate division Zixibacteria bacterium]|nr:AmmeMemoRadiSam system protein B [candidate division Zixibacteria bacterium]MDD4916439.1 AmmeMemoRadiSam system protein B [candidate division Zixibacteria bacterium]MDM7972904.1 AmmeMemoRadiSam system protein B [candidate division Zixibacteria bacterium]HOD66417.1 AmmeMemoRadiSam system protein B [candidate division Zixibacteria bacterium]HOZ07293.1 AmmeMemoRadiSam system protein B [candidate division Zixibacteria bacterium]
MTRFTVCFLLVLPAAAALAASAPPVTRPPAVAGSFYPGDSAELAAMIAGQLAAAPAAAIDGRIVAIVVPHAGLVYSGPIAAHAYKALAGRPIETAILCGPAHRYGFRGASVYGPGVTWQTPLGPVPCDDARIERLLGASSWLKVVPEAHLKEHGLEVQLPFLQTVLPGAHIVPIAMGYPDGHTVDGLTAALVAAARPPGAVLIASTDWQHYRPAAGGYPMDSLGLACLAAFDADALLRNLEAKKVEACGGAGVVAVMRAARKLGADKVKILGYGDSGDLTGDKSSVVGYAAVAFYCSADGENSAAPGEAAAPEKGMEPYDLTQEERQTLLTIARRSIIGYLEDGAAPDFEAAGKLAEPGAAFVTLEKQGRLRGCIGHVVAADPLFRTVAACAVQAAVGDPRFEPVTRSEIDQLTIEISVLTPLQAVTIFEEIEVGRDGLIISLGPNRGLLLPQVATEYGWTREEFLRQTCRKAGLSPDAYKSPQAKVERFQALVFGEE